MRLRIPFTKKEIEFRSSLSQPSDDFVNWAMGGGGPVKSGVTVTENTALQITAYLAAVKIISETIASLPLNFYKRQADGSKDRADKHPLYRVLHDQSNDEMTAFQFREALQGHICSWGNGYAEIERNGRGDIIALWPLLPDQTWPERGPDQKIRYRTTVATTGQQVLLPFEKVLHIPGFGFDGLIGYNPVRLAREALGMAAAAEEFGARFFGEGANVSGIVEYPGKLSDQAYERYKKDANAAVGGLKNSHRLWILEQGLKYHRVGIPPEEAQFLQTRKFQIAEIARMFRVPLHFLGELDRATFSNIEQQSIDFVVHTLRPWLVRWEQQIKMKLLTPTEAKAGYFAEFLVDALLRGDTKSRYESYQLALQNGILNRDEIRAMENYNPIADGSGQIYTVNAATLKLSDVPTAGEGGGSDGQAQGNEVNPATGEPTGD